MTIQLRNKKILVADKEIQKTLDLASKAARTSSTVLIHGPSGTGKELFARYIHEKSSRANYPFVSMNCAAIPEGLMEAECFGYEKGAFTGAIQQRIGKFERASSGSILLDEISEMPVTLQAKLLRVLQENEIERLGGKEVVTINSRIIATTNRNLVEYVQEKKFREDLFYRVNVISIFCKPLSGRTEAIIKFADHFVKSICEKNSLPEIRIQKEAYEKLISYSWPGNIRELQNAIEKAIWLSDEKTLSEQDIQVSERIQENTFSENLEDLEKKQILKILQEKNGNRTATAESLGINVRTLRNKLKEYYSAQ
jgi:transcriptional regulator with PAS, ATPase and Fis domain